jgi:glycerate-2-kinase
MNENYLELINAIIKRAADDYSNALCVTKGKTVTPQESRVRIKANEMIFSCEKFFRESSFMALYPGFNGEALIQRLRREAKEYGYNYRALMKSRSFT